ncbi:MAG: arsenate reductase ArsC [Woeseiaceae bacterium]|nr:arsenate reductase ArsC [Woeseiaceae bacterium]
MSQPIRILVLCTGNSARSILGEVLINDLGGGRFEAWSAGSQPAGRVNPGALAKLEREGHATRGLSSKSWDAFAEAGAPAMDIVITVCDNAAGESCPAWHGSPVRIHWGIADPAAAPPEQRDAAFDRAYEQLRARVEAMLEVPLEDLDTRQRKDALERIHDAIAAST